MESNICKIRITKCYLVEICDKSGKAQESDFCFGTKEDCYKLADRMISGLNTINIEK